MTSQPAHPAKNVETELPLALLLCADVMFAVELQNIARKAGFRHRSVAAASPLPPAAVLVVDLASRGDWQATIQQAVDLSIPVVAFGPHVDAVSRHAAKAVGASRVLANSNLTRDLPAILLALRQANAVATETVTLAQEEADK